MRTYEHPETFETFKAATPEHAAARVHGGKPGDYLAVTKFRPSLWDGEPEVEYLDVHRADSMEYIGMIYVLRH